MNTGATQVEPGMESARRVEALDALRGVAALAVVLFHYTDRYAELYGASPIGLRFTWGRHGVDLFFMISGYVILMTLWRCRSSRAFVVSRFSRLYPTYWLGVMLTFAAASIYGGGYLPQWRVQLSDLLWNLTMVQEQFGHPSVDGVYWSLAVELRFYALMWLAWRLGGLRHPLLLLSAWNLLVMGQTWWPSSATTHLILKWIPLFTVGMVAYLANQEGQLSRPHWGTLAAAAMAIFAALPWQDALADLIVGAAFLWVSQRRLRLSHPALLWLGAVSYPLYLVHQNIGYIVIGRVGGAQGFLAAMVVALLLAAVIHHGFERQSTRLMRRWLGVGRS